ncbi:hypothetical protein DSO57_1004820 [Entomophthora muscae]|uniref:Uncharacterized protein n=1 Tax=Entomophthora muscae TaxID=34485 RepID=A0ACC2RMW9_9FUNG|nr:hypothetical protein DSO57_1004820 [Entomophthora muscae]
MEIKFLFADIPVPTITVCNIGSTLSTATLLLFAASPPKVAKCIEPICQAIPLQNPGCIPQLLNRSKFQSSPTITLPPPNVGPSQEVDAWTNPEGQAKDITSQAIGIPATAYLASFKTERLELPLQYFALPLAQVPEAFPGILVPFGLIHAKLYLRKGQVTW